MAGNKVSIETKVPGAKQATGEVKNLHDAYTRLQKGGLKGFGIGVGAAATTKAFNVVGQAIGAVTDLIGDSKDAFIEDAHSQQLLRTSLRANVEGWDENTDAIERRISAGQKLGFTDEEQRASLASLVGAYGDAAKALDVMRTAEDLARFSGASLATSSDTLIKVHAGNYRALKALGINTKGITSETQAFAAIMKITAGQAEDYAGSLEGRLLTSAQRTDEALEHLGETTAEFSADLEEAKAGAIENFVTGLDYLVDSLNYSNQSMERKIELARVVINMNPLLSQAMKDEANAALDSAAAAKTHGDELAGVRAATKDVIAATDDLPDSLGDAADATDELTDAERRNISKTKAVADALDRISGIADKLPDKLNDLNDALFGDAQRKGDIAEAQQDLADLLDTEPKKGTRAWKIWAGDVAAARERLFELQFQMKESEGPAALDEWLRKQRDMLGKADVKARNYLNTLIALNSLKLGTAARAAVGAITDGRFSGKIVPLAEGGIVKHKPGGTLAVIGEGAHDEAVIPLGKPGVVADAGESVAAEAPTPIATPTGGSTTQLHFHFPNAFGMTPGQADQFARAVAPYLTRYQQRTGQLGAAGPF